MIETRKHWMAVLAKAAPEALAERMATLDLPSDVTVLRAPEIGAVMVRGRMGGVGAAFNLGETTVTRCSVRLADGTVGHGYVSGRDRGHARNAALCDALLQGPRAAEVRTAVIEPLEQAQAQRRAALAAKANGTRVEFFTMARGEP